MLSRPRSLLLIALMAAVIAVVIYAAFSDYYTTAPEYRTAEVARGPLTVSVSAVGTLNAVKLVQVGAEISGQIRELYADFNSTVRAGDVIALIAPENFSAQVDQVKAQLDRAEAGILAAEVHHERTNAEMLRVRAEGAVYSARIQGAQVVINQSVRELARKSARESKGFVSASELEKAQVARDGALATMAAAKAEQAAHGAALTAARIDVKAARVGILQSQADFRQAQAALRQAKADLKRTRIAAPIDGIIIERNVVVGQTVASSLQAPTLFTIAEDLKKLQVETYIHETDIGRVRVGDAATFSVRAHPGIVFSGKVKQIRKAPLVIQNVVTYMVIVSVNNDSGLLLPGTTAKVDIVSTQFKDALLVPDAALRFRPQGQKDDKPKIAPAAENVAAIRYRSGRVYVRANGGKLTAVDLKISAGDGRFTRIVKGALKPGDQVILGIKRKKGGRTKSLRLP
jgi:HlyD family secretion protein